MNLKKTQNLYHSFIQVTQNFFKKKIMYFYTKQYVNGLFSIYFLIILWIWPESEKNNIINDQKPSLIIKNKRHPCRCCQFSERLMVLWQEADETVIIISLHTSIYFYSSTQRIITVIHSSDSSPSWACASKKFFPPSFNKLFRTIINIMQLCACANRRCRSQTRTSAAWNLFLSPCSP